MSRMPTLPQTLQLTAPAPNWLWTLDIFTFDNYLMVSNLQILEVTFPFSAIEIDSRYRAGSFIFFPGKNNIDKVTVGFIETEDFMVLQAFKKWQALIINADGMHALPKDYMGSMVLTNYDNTGHPRVECNLSGIWPAQLSDWSLNYSASGHLPLQVTFSVNSSKFTFYGASGIAADAPAGTVTIDDISFQ